MEIITEFHEILFMGHGIPQKSTEFQAISHGIWKLYGSTANIRNSVLTEFRGHPSTNKTESTVKSKTTEMLETPVVKETSTAVGMAATAETL
jgi:hypothetical protein